MGRIAEVMKVVPGTATTMVKSLFEAGLIDYEPRRGVLLSDKGESLALDMLRRHRIIELFLVEILDLDWSEIHEEAERWEHVISDRVLQKIDALLGHPKVDPHGDPIPSAKGNLDLRSLQNLTDCKLNTELHISRILDQEPGFLQYLEERKLTPGTQIRVVSRSDEASSITVCKQDKSTTVLGFSAAGKILVE